MNPSKTTIMKSLLLRLTLIAAILGSIAITSSVARDNTTKPDRAAELLAQYGYLLVKSAGPTIVPGTYQTEVLLRMGKPETITADGAWLYPNYEVRNSRINGTLVMRFEDDAISELILIPAEKVSQKLSHHTPRHAKH